MLGDKDAYDAFVGIPNQKKDFDDEAKIHKKERIIIMILHVGHALYLGKKSGYVEKDWYDNYMSNLINVWIANDKELTLSILDHWHTDYGRSLVEKIKNSPSNVMAS